MKPIAAGLSHEEIRETRLIPFSLVKTLNIWYCSWSSLPKIVEVVASMRLSCTRSRIG